MQGARARRAHKKSRTGCRSCRTRKVKCDERRPLCANCERHFANLIACDFDDQEPALKNPYVELSPVTETTIPSSIAVQAVERHENAAGGLGGRQAESMDMLTQVAIRSVNELGHHESARTESVLIEHYLSNLSPRSFPFYASKVLMELWWPFVNEDPCLLQTVQLMSCYDKDLIENTPNSVATQQLMGDCFENLRQNVREPLSTISDQATVSIALLSALEHNRNNFRAMRLHVDALKRITASRGGLCSIARTNPLAATIIFWYSMVTSDEPYIIPIPLSMTPHHIPQQDLEEDEGGWLQFGLDLDTAMLLTEVQRVSEKYTSTMFLEDTTQAVDVLIRLCAIIESLIAPQDHSKPPLASISRSCRLGGCLHCLVPLSAYFPSPTLSINSTLRDLKASIAQSMLEASIDNALVFWLLAVGGLAAHAMPERSWFVGHLSSFAAELSITNFEQVQRHLNQFAVHDAFCNVNFRLLWDEVYQKQQQLQLDA